ncbi:MAG: DUF3995 domain-containing protein [Ornithinimicrobium sp.]
MGTDQADTFRGREWLLAPVGMVKLAAAIAPLMLAWSGWLARSIVRGVCWLGAVVLTVWGGLNAVVANLVLAGVIRPEGRFDRPGMIGHALIWDPLFLA